MSKDLLVLADEYAAATATFARALALKDKADSMSPIAREAGDKRAVLAEALAALDIAQPERAPLSADAYEVLVDDLGEWSRHVVEDTAHITLDTHIRRTLAVHGIKQGGQQ